MTNNRTVKDERRFESSSEHRATPGREPGIIGTLFGLFFVRLSETSGFGQSSFGLLSANCNSDNRNSDNRYAPEASAFLNI